MNSPPNHEWEEGLDIDDSDLRQTLVVHPSNNPHIVPEITTTTQTLISSQNHQVDTYNECKQALDIDDSDLPLTPFRYSRRWGGICNIYRRVYRKVIEDVGDDDDFTRTSWLSVLEYVNVDGEIMTGCFGGVMKFLKNGKLEKVVVVIKSCTPNALGDLTVTLKDLSGTIFDTIHYKVLTKERFAKVITVGAALILHNVSVFSPKQSTHHYLNITKKNMVKLYHKDGGSL
ncbi:hypothetical protein Tco_0139155 [Tanacetum coccineum]